MINNINKTWPMVLIYVINSLRISLFFCLDLIKTFLKNKETSWRRTNTPKIKSSEKSVNSIKIEVLSTYVLSGSKGSKYTYSADQIRKKKRELNIYPHNQLLRKQLHPVRNDNLCRHCRILLNTSRHQQWNYLG